VCYKDEEERGSGQRKDQKKDRPLLSVSALFFLSFVIGTQLRCVDESTWENHERKRVKERGKDGKKREEVRPLLSVRFYNYKSIAIITTGG
jgi:hypothetical protein